MGYLTSIGQCVMGVEPTRDAAPVALTYIDIVGPVDTSNLAQNVIENDDWKVHVEEEAPYIGEKSGSTVQIMKHLATRTASAAIPVVGPTATTEATMFVEHPDIMMVAQAMGNHHIFADGAAQAFTQWTAHVAGTKTVTVDSSADYVVGEIVAFYTSSGAPGTADIKLEVRRIASIPAGGVSLVLDIPLSQDHPCLTPVAPGTPRDMVYAGVTAFTTDAWQLKTLQAEIQGHATADKYTVKGMRPSGMKLAMNPLDMGSLTVDYKVHTWTRAAGAALAYKARVAGGKQQVLGGRCVIWDGSTIVELDVSTAEFDEGLESVNLKTVSDDEGVNDGQLLAHKARLTLNPTFASEALFTAFNATTPYAVHFYWGGQVGKLWDVCMSGARIIKYPGLKDKEGVRAHDLVFASNRHEDSAAPVAWDDTVPKDKSCYIASI